MAEHEQYVAKKEDWNMEYDDFVTFFHWLILYVTNYGTKESM
jgi:hypothetical protein